jgi:precorrin-6B methylase 2
LGGSFREQGLHGFSTPLRRGTNFGSGDFGSRPIEWWRWVDSRRHIRLRDPHLRWRSRFFVIHVPGFFGTWGMTPYIPITPYVAPLTSYYIPGPAWSEQSRDYFAAGPAPARERGRLAPFDPTPQEIVQRMLALGELTAQDVVYDLGAGDGRIAIAAAKHYGVRAVGIEIDPGLVTLARENVRREGLERLVEIREQDFMAADLSPATVVTLYLSHEGNLAVRPKLFRELRPGARVVSYTFDMAEWQPKIAESYRDAAGARHMIYLWQISDSLVFSDNRP